MITQRIKQYVDYKKFTVSSFEVSIGASNGMLRRAFIAKTDIKSQWLEKILEKYHDINTLWLLTGQGEMITENEQKEMRVKKYTLRSDNLKDYQVIPLYNIEASAGLVPLFSDPKKHEPIDYLQIPNLPPCDGAVHVIGDSMYPLLKSGDIVLYKKIHDIKNNIFWGEIYLISIAVDDEEFITLKYIQKSDKGEEYVKLVSQNQHHQPKNIRLDRIKALAFVKASIRMNSMG